MTRWGGLAPPPTPEGSPTARPVVFIQIRQRRCDARRPATKARFCRRRITDEGIDMPSRYFATVRRATSIPCSFCSISAMVSSGQNIARGFCLDQLTDAMTHGLGRVVRLARR